MELIAATGIDLNKSMTDDLRRLYRASICLFALLSLLLAPTGSVLLVGIFGPTSLALTLNILIFIVRITLSDDLDFFNRLHTNHAASFIDGQ